MFLLDADSISWSAEAAMENLVEEMLTLHASSSTFRQVFESQQMTQIFIDSFKSMVDKISSARSINGWSVKILEKLTHFGLALALDNAVGGSQKRQVSLDRVYDAIAVDLPLRLQILDQIQSAEMVLNPSARAMTIDPGLVVDNRSIRQRLASARLSMQVGERTVIKTMTRINEWRKTVQVSERKRIRKTILDMSVSLPVLPHILLNKMCI